MNVSFSSKDDPNFFQDCYMTFHERFAIFQQSFQGVGARLMVCKLEKE